MSACVVWLDSEHGKIFKISDTGVERSKVNHHEVHPTGSHHDQHKKNAEDHFFKELATKIGKVNELLLFGSGNGRVHFKTYIEKHFKKELSDKVVGVEPLDHLTDNQILEASRKFFKAHYSFPIDLD